MGGVVVGLGFEGLEAEDADEDSDFVDVAVSEACSLMELSFGFSPESFGDAKSWNRCAVVKDRIGVYCRLGRNFDGHSLAGGSLKGFIVCKASS